MFVSSPVFSVMHRSACLLLLGAALMATHPAAAQAPAVPASQGSPVAAQTPGCNPAVQAAAQSVAEAKVAAARAAIDDAINQPPSVLQQTCFNQAAGVSASKGGDTFSGYFGDDLQPIVSSALTSFYRNFDSAVSSFFGSVAGGASVGSAASGAIGSLLSGAFGSGNTSVQGDSYECDGIEQTWEAMNDRGVTTGAAPSFAELINGTPPAGANEKFKKSFQASKEAGVFDNAKSAVAALPKPQVQSYTGTESLCDVMNALGLGGCNAR